MDEGDERDVASGEGTEAGQAREPGWRRGVLRNPYKGIRHDRYQFMLDNMPEEARRLDEADEMQDYLYSVEWRYQQRASEIGEERAKELGVVPEMAWEDFGRWVAIWREALAYGREMAWHEVVEAR